LVSKIAFVHLFPHLINPFFIAPQLKALGVTPTIAFITYDTTNYTKQLVPVIRAYGKIGSIVETDDGVSIHQDGGFVKAISFHWEFMFSKAMFGYNLDSQGKILEQIAKLADNGTLTSQVTVKKELTVANLQELHQLQASGKSHGKIAFSVPETLS
jgi:NADPH:quinone reductase